MTYVTKLYYIGLILQKGGDTIMVDIEPKGKNLEPITIHTDGPQGGKVVLGISDSKEFDDLNQKVLETGDTSIAGIRNAAQELGIPVVDD